MISFPRQHTQAIRRNQFGCLQDVCQALNIEQWSPFGQRMDVCEWEHRHQGTKEIAARIRGLNYEILYIMPYLSRSTFTLLTALLLILCAHCCWEAFITIQPGSVFANNKRQICRTPNENIGPRKKYSDTPYLTDNYTHFPVTFKCILR